MKMTEGSGFFLQREWKQNKSTDASDPGFSVSFYSLQIKQKKNKYINFTISILSVDSRNLYHVSHTIIFLIKSMQRSCKQGVGENLQDKVTECLKAEFVTLYKAQYALFPEWMWKRNQHTCTLESCFFFVTVLTSDVGGSSLLVDFITTVTFPLLLQDIPFNAFLYVTVHCVLILALAVFFSSSILFTG